VVTVDSIPVVTISPSPASYCQGENVTLTSSGAVTYQWSPSTGLNVTTGDTVIANPSIATTYTITGINSNSCISQDTVTVSVTFPPAKPTITVNNNLLTSSATQGNQWLLNNTIIPGATNQTYTALISGTYSVISKNPVNGCSSISDTVNVVVTGINQLPVVNNQLSIYPNPSSGLFTIASAKNIDEVKVTNVLGQLIYESYPKQTQFTFELNDAGMYFITATSGNEITTGKVLVIK
jgi:hypothetical protein